MNASLITCSYAPDRDRCGVLCASVDRFVEPGMEHVLVVPRRDVELFAPLVNDRRRIVVAEDLLPRWLVRAPRSRRWWLTPFTPPVRGWIVQQVIKLSLPAAVETPVLIFADSDVVFVKPFGSDNVIRNDRVRLHRVPGHGTKPFHLRWHRSAARLLGLPPTDHHGSDYITQLVSWRREYVLALQRRLEEVSRRDWRRQLCGTLHFSEYILYGVFVEHVLGDAACHYWDAQELCHCSWHWHRRIENEAELGRFLSRMEPQHVAVLVQSNLGLSVDRYSHLLQPAAEAPARRELVVAV